jgi:hypothetical protein
LKVDWGRDNKYAQLLHLIQEANDYAVYALVKGGYNGAALQGLLKGVPKALAMTAITENKMKEQIALLAQATTLRDQWKSRLLG